MAAGGKGEVLVSHGDVDARLEGGVDVVDAVGGEEEDSLVVFEDTEEDSREVSYNLRWGKQVTY